MNLHDALELGRVERVNHSLSTSDLKLRLAICERRTRVGNVSILTKRVDGSAFRVLSDVVVCEFPSHPEKGAVELEHLRSRRS